MMLLNVPVLRFAQVVDDDFQLERGEDPLPLVIACEQQLFPQLFVAPQPAGELGGCRFGLDVLEVKQGQLGVAVDFILVHDVSLFLVVVLSVVFVLNILRV